MLNKKLLMSLLGIGILAFSFNCSAKNIKLAVKLTKIQALKTTEAAGDEVYFSIAEYSSKSIPKLSREPMFPLHWLSKELPQISDVVLWQGELAENDSVLLIMSLLEQDLEPWNSDDHIGSAQVKIANKNGKLVSKWGQPHFNDQPRVQQPDVAVPKFIMYGDGGKYVTVFKVEVLR